MNDKVSNGQLEDLVEFLAEHPNLAKGVGLGPRSKETVDLLWSTLAKGLTVEGLALPKLVYSGRKQKSKLGIGNKETCGSPTIHEEDSCKEKLLCKLDTYGSTKNKCFRCKCLLENVYKFLEELSALRKQEGIGICDHCNYNRCDIDCPKCLYLIEKFFATKREAREEYNAERLKMWLQKFRHLLGSFCANQCMIKQKPCKKKCTDEELEKLLRGLKEPDQMRELDIEVLFPSSSKQLRTDGCDNEQNFVKDEKNNKDLSKKYARKDGKGEKKSKKDQRKSEKSKGDTNIEEGEKSQKELDDETSKDGGKDSGKESKSRRRDGKRRKGKRNEDMSNLNINERENDFLKCHPASEMILGNLIVPYESKKRVKRLKKKPLYFDTLYKVDDIPHEEPATTAINIILDNTKTNKKGENPAFLNYALSNIEFVEKGLTVLPKQSIIQKVVLYRTAPSEPEYDWFKINVEKLPLYYESGQLLAKADESNGACWFYQNGNISLIYYNDEENNATPRYEVFSTGSDENGRDQPITVLAVFDFGGNCIVYDHDGNVRLKYNQAEGIVYDRTIATPCRWLWHDLNRPPHLHIELVDSKCPEECVTKLAHAAAESLKTEQAPSERDEKMAGVLFSNCVKENKSQAKRSFKPFAIKPKIFKLNEYFFIRIIDQRSIYLLFRDGVVTMKLHLGFTLLRDEIFDIATTEVCNVLTPYDGVPPTPGMPL